MHSFTFNGVNSRTYGLMVSGSGAFNAPERDVSVISIPGRNGDLVVDNGRYKNITVEYPGFIAENFRVNARGARSWLTSPLGYKRLEDDYNPDEYRLARFKEGLEFEMLGENEAGTTTIKFDCLPQRFLKSGEEEIQFDNEIETLSGSVVTFQNDGKKIISSFEAEINPIQEGSGDPYPAGGGNNLFPKPNQNTTYTYEGVYIDRKIDGSFIIRGSSEINDLYMYASLPSDQVVSSGMYFSFGTNDVQSWFGDGNRFKVFLLNTYPTNGRAPTSNEILAEYVPNENNEPVLIQNSGTAKSIGIFAGLMTFPYQVTLTCWPTFASTKEGAKFKNIRPITGWTGAKVTRTGANLLDNSELFDYSNWSATVAPNGNMKSSNPNKIYTLPQLVSGEAYTISFGFDNSFPEYLYFGYYKNGEATLLSYITTGSVVHTTYTFTAENGYNYCFRMGSTENQGTFDAQIAKWRSCQLELGSTATEYEPYQADTYSITFPSEAGTVYGGTLDATNGVLTVNRAMVEYDGSNDESWNEYGKDSDHYCCTVLPRMKAIGYQKSICNEFKNQNAAFGSSSYGMYSDHPSSEMTYFRMPNAGVTTKAEFLTWIAENNIQLVYELATPLTYQLTPQEVTTLLGVNNIWADTGEITVDISLDNRLENPTAFDALPLIKIEGSGEGILTINNQVVTISNIDEYVILDSDLKIAYKGSESKTNTMVGEFPILSPGNNIISYSGGITSVKITPRWWIL